MEAVLEARPAKNSPNLRLRVGTPPAKYAPWIESVVLIERLREVQALAGFSRLEAAGKIRPRNWRRCGEVRQSGCRRRRCEAKDCSCGSPKRKYRMAGESRTLEAQFFGAHRRWRAQRGSGAITGVSRAAIRAAALVVARPDPPVFGGMWIRGSQPEGTHLLVDAEDEEAMAGILIYTAAPDSEGTLGGLVTLGETANLEQHLDQALECLEICSSDPLCAETQPEQAFLSLHGSACHNCLFLAGNFLRARQSVS